jgi:hypothetical protein
MRWAMPSAYEYDYLYGRLDDNINDLGDWLRENEEALENLGPDDEDRGPDGGTIDLGYALKVWVEQGNGVEVCGGDYSMLLRIALDIACNWKSSAGQRLWAESGPFSVLSG